MKLYTLLQAYNFDELMRVINDMFPGTKKYREEFAQAYDLMINMRPVASKKTIRYELKQMPGSDMMYIGAADSCFTGTWEVTLGKEVQRDRGANLDELEVLCNCFVNTCLLGKCPASFRTAQEKLTAER